MCSSVAQVTSSGNTWGKQTAKVTVARPNRSEVQALASKWGLDERATAWLIMALDPFHDTAVNVEGLPDPSVEPTFTFAVTKSVQISKPAGITTTNWGCHVFNTPLLDGHALHQGSQITQGVWQTGNAAVDLNIGLVNIVCADDGADFLPNQSNGITLAANDFITGPDIESYFDGPSRIVGFGWEIHNTTATLERQGTVTCYRQPSHPTVQSMLHYVGTTTAFTSSGAALYIGPAWRLSMPPVNVDAAMSLPGTTQWAAEEGPLQVVPFSSMDNPLEASRVGQVYFADTDADHGGNVGLITKNSDPFGAFASKPSITVNTGAHVFGNGRVFRVAPLMQCGSIFTGLSSTTTLTLTVRLLIERAPDASQPTLAVLAKPSPTYDPRAFELYLRLIHETKPAVPVSMNPKGEFWRGLLKIADTAATVASIALPEFAPAIQTGMGIVHGLDKAFSKKGKGKAKRR